MQTRYITTNFETFAGTTALRRLYSRKKASHQMTKEPGSSSIVRLNIGGKKFSTTVDTLTNREPQSMLYAMFSGRHTVSEDPGSGCVYVDRDGKHFRHILNWLRDGVVPILTDAKYSELMREAEYYQLLEFIEAINHAVNQRKQGDETDAELTRTDVLKCIQSEKVRFRGVNLSGLDLSKLDLSFVDFSFASLRNVFFSRANLQCAKFRDVDAEGSIFHNATLRDEDANSLVQIFVELYWPELIFRVQICKANFGCLDACLVDCSFCGADLRSAHLQTADLTNANLEGANLEGANLKGAKLNNANLKGANLQRAYMRQVNLQNADLDGAKLDGANLVGAIR
ncbi:FH protein interacting protein FIP2 [Linum perenne]